MPSASSSHEVTVAQPADGLWQILQNADTWANIGPVERVWDPVHDAAGTLMSYRWSTTVAGRPYEGTAKTMAAEPPSSIQQELDGGEVAGVLTTRLSPNADPSHTTITVHLEVSSRGALSAMFFPIIADAINRGLPDQVEEFAGRLSNPDAP
jgi:carbon monoxide dehydrogenase subunit G